VGSVFFIALQRLRAPLIVIIVIFAVATAGLTLIPGVDAEGRPYHLSLFQAFYFVSYTASTIGFGEIPHPFTDRQRLWVTIIIYLSVLGWAFLVASILALLQDKGFRQAIVSAHFARLVRGLREPFYILCGLGETGLIIARSLDRLDFRFAVLDVDERRIQELKLEQLGSDPPALAGDARLPDALIMAGLLKPQCQGVLALSNDDQANLAIAINVSLLHPHLRTICRCHTPEIAASMVAVGAYQVVNPFREFGDRLAIAMRAPNTYRLLSWLTGIPGSHLPPPIPAPPGRWIVCGYGRFGAEVVDSIMRGGFDVRIIDPDPAVTGAVDVICGRGTDAAVLGQAGIEEAAGIVAGTDDDTANLAIAIAARQVNKDLFVIARQNLVSNRLLFKACNADMTMVSSEIVANECLAILRTRLLAEFLSIVRARDDAWAERIVEHLRSVVGDEVPHFWCTDISADEAPGLLDVMRRGRQRVMISDLRRDIAERDRRAPCIALLVVRAREAIEMPADDMEIAPGDAILFAGTSAAARDLKYLLRNANYAQYAILGADELGGLVWRSVSRALRARSGRQRSLS
jgi:Trk K+ transport system NAD-binding subunit